MFEIPAAELVANLERIGGRLCVYGGGEWRDRRCDCKYGATFGGEDQGCAEIRLVIRWLESTPEPGAEAHVKSDRQQAISILRGFAQQATEFADELVGPQEESRS